MCTTRGYQDNGEKISFYTFPYELLKKKWIDAKRRDEGPNFRVTKSTVVCSNHFRENDVSSIIKADRPGFLRGREGAGGGAHILRGRTLIRISCPDWSNSVRTPRDVRYSRALIGRKAYVHPVTYAIPVL